MSLVHILQQQFTDLWHKDHAHLHDSILSCTGCVITLAGAHIHWFSKLQNKITLRMTEAKYVALSTCIRELLPLHSILSDIIKLGPIDHDHDNIDLQDNISLTTTSLQSKQNCKLPPSIIYEDNAGCVVLATEHDQNCPRTKHIGINTTTSETKFILDT